MRSILAEYQDTWWQSLWEILILCAGVYVNREMIRNLSVTFGKMAADSANSVRAQQISLNHLVQVVLDNRAALDFFCWLNKEMFVPLVTFLVTLISTPEET